MSQRWIDVSPPNEVAEILTGWDRPLQYWFAVAFDFDGDPVESNLDRENPGMTLDEISDLVQRHTGQPLPADVRRLLEQDRQENAGNIVTRHKL